MLLLSKILINLFIINNKQMSEDYRRRQEQVLNFSFWKKKKMETTAQKI